MAHKQSEKLSELYDPEFYPYRRKTNQTLLKSKRKSIKVQTCLTNSQKWTVFENRNYLEFLKANQQVLQNRNQHQKRSIFVKMALSVKTRNSIQCKSHHQKMLIRNKSINLIIKRMGDTFLNQQKQHPHQKNSREQRQSLFQMNQEQTPFSNDQASTNQDQTTEFQNPSQFRNQQIFDVLSL